MCTVPDQRQKWLIFGKIQMKLCKPKKAWTFNNSIFNDFNHGHALYLDKLNILALYVANQASIEQWQANLFTIILRQFISNIPLQTYQS